MSGRHLVLEVDRDRATGRLQLNISEMDEHRAGLGYRLAGPKYGLGCDNLLSHRLTERDATEIRRYLDRVFPMSADRGAVETP